MTEKTSLLAGAAPRAMFGAPAGVSPLLRGPQAAFAPEDEGGGGGLSIDAAVALLDAHDEPEEGGGAGDGAPAGGEEEHPEGAASAPVDAEDGAETPAEDGDGSDDGAVETDEQDPAAVAPAEAPKYWSKEAKARFAELAPDLQAVVLAQEGPREEAAAKAKAEAAQVREAADKDMADVRALAAELQSFLPQAIETFRSRWGDQPPDWAAYAERHGAEAAFTAKERYEAQRDQLRRTAEATQKAEAEAHRAFLVEESQKLATLDPELADPKEGKVRRQEVGQYLVDSGVPREALRNLTAIEMSLARKAMLWDRAQAKATTPNPKPKPGERPAARPPLTRGGAASGPVDPKLKQAQTAKNRFAQTKSVSDAVAYLNSLED